MSFTCGHTPGCGVVCSECQPVPPSPMPGNAPYLWTPMPCPDCLALAKVILDIFHHAQNGAELDAVWHTLDAFIKERER